VSTSLTDRFISISAQQLASIPNVIAVAGGPSKRLAVKAALTSGLINSLVTDVSTACYRSASRSAPTASPRERIANPWAPIIW
jgi:Putative sugar-binding domain